jgi:multisubunit Na+/H+ antiporter MnhC subunit
MTGEAAPLFAVFVTGVGLVLITGLYCVLTTRNLIRTLIGLEIATKAVMLLLLTCGAAAGRLALAQSLVITCIVLEVVVIAVATGIVLGFHHHTHSLDTAGLRNLKG